MLERRGDLFQQLNKMPIANVTKSHIELKKKIEIDLDELENAIKLFSSKKPVFVSDTDSFSH